MRPRAIFNDSAVSTNLGLHTSRSRPLHQYVSSAAACRLGFQVGAALTASGNGMRVSYPRTFSMLDSPMDAHAVMTTASLADVKKQLSSTVAIEDMSLIPCCTALVDGCNEVRRPS
jgi:hypothetical protein